MLIVGRFNSVAALAAAGLLALLAVACGSGGDAEGSEPMPAPMPTAAEPAPEVVEPDPAPATSPPADDEPLAAAVAQPVLETATRMFVEAFGDGGQGGGEPSSILVISYSEGLGGAVSGMAEIDAGTRAVEGDPLGERVAQSLMDAGLASAVLRVDVRSSTLSPEYAFALGVEVSENTYIIRAFGEIDAEAAALSLSGGGPGVEFICHWRCGPRQGGSGVIDPLPEETEEERLEREAAEMQEEEEAEEVDASEPEREVVQEQQPVVPPQQPVVPPQQPVVPTQPAERAIPLITPQPAPLSRAFGHDFPEPIAHIGGAPYPPGSAPPEVAAAWADLRNERLYGILGGPTACWGSFRGYVKDQLVFYYEGAPASPRAAISADLRAAGIRFSSIEVRDAAYYDRYQSGAFYNWLRPLGITPRYTLYQVILNGHDGDVRRYRLPNATTTHFYNCSAAPEINVILSHVARGIYTTFGDDVVFYALSSQEQRVLYPWFSPWEDRDEYTHREISGLFSGNSDAPLLLNDPPAPVHTGGEPYPLGMFPPERAPLWDALIDDLQERGSSFESYSLYGASGAAACRAPRAYGYVRDQLVFMLSDDLQDPAGAIEAALRKEDIQFESIEVRGAEHYGSKPTQFNWIHPAGEYDVSDLFNLPNWHWLGLYTYRHTAALRSHGLDLSVEFLRTLPFSRYAPSDERGLLYQVILHGHEGDVRGYTDLPHAWPVDFVKSPEFSSGCLADEDHLAAHLLVAGVYTVFGDDIVLYDDGPSLEGNLRQRFGSKSPLTQAIADMDDKMTEPVMMTPTIDTKPGTPTIDTKKPGMETGTPTVDTKKLGTGTIDTRQPGMDMQPAATGTTSSLLGGGEARVQAVLRAHGAAAGVPPPHHAARHGILAERVRIRAPASIRI